LGQPGRQRIHSLHASGDTFGSVKHLIDLALDEQVDRASHVEVAIAAGAHPHERLMDLVLMVERLRRDYPVVLWQQGHLGEVGIAAGATGYECGIGWREACNINTSKNNRRRQQHSGARQARPVYISALGRSLPKRSLQAISRHRDLWLRLICPDPDCYLPGGRGLLGDARAHAVVQRARQLERIAHIDTPVWRWQRLAEMGDTGLALADRINPPRPNQSAYHTSRLASAVRYQHGQPRPSTTQPGHTRRIAAHCSPYGTTPWVRHRIERRNRERDARRL
jgi:hypothetical protein